LVFPANRGHQESISLRRPRQAKTDLTQGL